MDEKPNTIARAFNDQNKLGNHYATALLFVDEGRVTQHDLKALMCTLYPDSMYAQSRYKLHAKS